MSKSEFCNNENNKRTVALFIPDLDIGGAERQLLELAKGLDKEKWDVIILTNSINPLLLAEVKDKKGLRIILLDKNRKLLYPFRLLAALRREKPNIINSYLLSAQVYTLFVLPFLTNVKVIFSIRDAIDYSVSFSAKRRYCWMLLEKCLSLVDCYIFNSAAGRRIRSALPSDKVHIIPNGIDTTRYCPDQSSRAYVRQEALIYGEVQIVGIVGNFSEYKGYDTFIRAARKVADRLPAVHFVAIGNQDTPLGKAMAGLVDELGLVSSFHFLGIRSDVHRLLPGFDAFCSSSVTEGFCNAICEGMACGVPCVVTDVGDSAMIVGETGIVVPPADPQRLADGMIKMLTLGPAERQHLGDAARTRIIDYFNIPVMVAATEKVFDKVLHD